MLLHSLLQTFLISAPKKESHWLRVQIWSHTPRIQPPKLSHVTFTSNMVINHVGENSALSSSHKSKPTIFRKGSTLKTWLKKEILYLTTPPVKLHLSKYGNGRTETYFPGVFWAVYNSTIWWLKLYRILNRSPKSRHSHQHRRTAFKSGCV